MLLRQSPPYRAAVISLAFLRTRCDSSASAPPLFTLSNSSFLDPGGIIEPLAHGRSDPSGDDPSAEWSKAVNNGARLYQEWEAKTGPDTENEALYKIIASDACHQRTRLTEDQKFLLSTSGLMPQPPNDSEFISYDFFGPAAPGALGPKEKLNTDIEYFDCAISAAASVILVTDWGRDDTATGWNNTDILWSMWNNAGRKFSPDPGTKPPVLQGLIFDPVSDKVTRQLQELAMAGGGIRLWRFTDLEEVDRTVFGANQYWAILGSPDGEIVQTLLTEHKNALEGMKVDAIIAHRRMDVVDDPSLTQYGLAFRF